MIRRSLLGYLGAGFAGLASVTGGGRRAEAGDDAPPRIGGSRAPSPNPWMPTKIFLTSGMGVHEREIQASDMALYQAGIGNFNRDRVSSIVPPKCKVISREEGLTYLQDGQVVFTVLPIVESNVPGTYIASAIGLAVPEDGSMGSIAEVYEEGTDPWTAEMAARRAVEMAMGILALRHQPDFDPTKVYDPARAVYKIGGKSVRVHSASQAARVDATGRHTSVLAAAVMII